MLLSAIKRISPIAIFWIILLFVTFVTLIVISRENFLLFHTIIEFVMTLVGFSIFVIALNTYPYAKNGFFLFLGTSYFFYTVLNFLHMVSYKGIEIIVKSADIPTQLWISERYLLALVFFVAPFLLGKKINFGKHIISVIWLSVFIVAVILFIFYYNVFPITFINGSGLTPFKIFSEYIISLIFLLDLIIFYIKRNKLDRETYFYVSCSLIFSILSELAFTKYISVYGNFNMIGHILAFVSIILIYAAFIKKTLNSPYSLLFKELRDANTKLSHLATTDHLTGLYNRRAVMEKIEEQFIKARRFGDSFSVVMIDLDNFKMINDKYGHFMGDKVLVEFAKELKQTLREVDILGRYGGDEFVVCPLRADTEVAEKIVNKIKKAVKNIKIKMQDGELITIKFSVGIHNCVPKNDKNLKTNHVIHLADTRLLENKRETKSALAVH